MQNPNDPATPRQIEYAKNLEIEFDPSSITKGEISQLIDKALKAKLPTAKQVEYAQALGIEVAEGISYKELAKLIDAELRRRGKEVLAKNDAVRAGNLIVYKDQIWKVLFAGRHGIRYQARLEPYFRTKGSRIIHVALASLANAVRADNHMVMQAAQQIRPAVPAQRRRASRVSNK